MGEKRWSSNEWLVTQGYQRHLLELGAADALLGEVTAKLKKSELYDKSLFIVVSDHGCSFVPDSRNRGDKETFAADTMPVPFILKLPQQRKGAISDENVEAIDILPTIADVLKISLPFSTDGQSAFDTSKPRRKEKTLFYEDLQYVVDAANESKYASLRKKLSIFGSGRTRPDGYFAIGPYGAIVGKAPTAFQQTTDPKIKFAFDEKSQFTNVKTTDNNNFVPCSVSGRILEDKPGAEPLHLAISVNGTIRAVTRTYQSSPSETTSFYAIIPDDALREGKNVVDLFRIHRDHEKRTRLTPLAEDRDSLLGESLVSSVYGKTPPFPWGRRGKLTIKTDPRNVSFQGWVLNNKVLPAIDKVVVFVNDQPVLTIAIEDPMTAKGKSRAGRRNRAVFNVVTSKNIFPDKERARAFAFAGEYAAELPVESIP